MSEDIAMRRALHDKLNDPAWRARSEKVYDRITGDDRRVPIVLDLRLPPKAELGAFLGLPEFEEPATIEELWLDRWQRSSGGCTITRMPDDTIRIELPSGARHIYSSIQEDKGPFKWIMEEFDSGGRRIHSCGSDESFDEQELALFEMNRTALTEFDELTNEY